MDNKLTEEDILKVLEKEPIISQRKISERTGLSLGMVNILLKRCIKKGFVKVENLNSRTVRYILTPRGVNEKTKKTLKYIKQSYKMIFQLTYKIEEYGLLHQKEKKKIVLFGNSDEVMNIASKVLFDKNIQFNRQSKIELLEKRDNVIAYVWETDYEEAAKKQRVNYVNLI